MAVKTNELARNDAVGVDIVNAQMGSLKALVRTSLKEGMDYGIIPGTGKKPTLLQPGAEKIALMLGITLRHDVTTSQLQGGHREVTVVAHAILRKTGEEVGDGVGLCSTMESKYRYRKDWDHKVNGKPGVIENRDVADVYNTVLKMAEKRADIDCVKRVASASEFFTQDVEDMPSYEVQAPPTPPTVHAVDVQPIRDRYKAWCAATGHGPKDGMGAILAQVGAISMQELTQEQVAQAVALMDARTAPQPAQEPTETPRQDEPVEPDLYDTDQEF